MFNTGEKSIAIVNIILLFAIVAQIVLVPYFDYVLDSDLNNYSLTVLVLAGVFSLDYHRMVQNLLVVGGFLVIIGIWVRTIFDQFEYALFFTFFVFLLILTVALIHRVAVSKKVSVGIVISAMSGYLLLGMSFSMLLMSLNLMDDKIVPVSFGEMTLNDFLYYGFTTMTTLGYGDIIPSTVMGKSLSILITVSGQMYMAILIALIVGKFLSQRQSNVS